MSEIQYFSRYSQKENLVTNNTLLLFKRLYNYSPYKFSQFINTMIEQMGVFINTTVKFEQQVKIDSRSVADGVFQQESFKFVIETKLDGAQNVEQLKNHWKAFKDEDKQIFLWIDRDPIQHNYLQEIEKELIQFNHENNQNIQLISTTFHQIYKDFIGILNTQDFEMYQLVEDYKEFCLESNIFTNSQMRARVVLTGDTYGENLKHGIYYDKRSRSYKTTVNAKLDSTVFHK